ncbi:MAG TPA: MotA/TolQ/ExbB proton channel family protein [Planctomycetota bacterium]|jgi:biopolymer transport protein ExbB|nr:MotA/TolQ/ExbB proton channel family protein [Planctomycetota bacterium]
MNSQRYTWGVYFIIFLLLFCTCEPAFAQDEGSKGTSTWELIKASGEIGALIIILSIVMVALAVDNFIILRRSRMIPILQLQDLEDLLDEEAYDEIHEICISDPNFMTNIFSAALSKIEDGYDAMLTATTNAIEEETIKLQQRISWLQFIGAVGPMLGLLGTVAGMIAAFSTIANKAGSPQPKDLAEGIYKALVTTCQGLIVAIPAMTFYFYFRNKIVRYSMEISGIMEEILDRFHKVES